ncbi:MAG: hypothetical protein ACXWQO_18590 [Bdellovibrionota bacterium]
MPARFQSTPQQEKGSVRSCASGTKASKKSGARPSFYLAASCLALAISGYLLLPSPQEAQENLDYLLGHAWQWIDSTPCADAEPGNFFEIESQQDSTEAYLSRTGRWLIASPALPEAPFVCHKINAPLFIQEIQ